VGPPYGKDSHTISILFPTTAGRGMTDHGDAYPGAVEHVDGQTPTWPSKANQFLLVASVG